MVKFSAFKSFLKVLISCLAYFLVGVVLGSKKLVLTISTATPRVLKLKSYTYFDGGEIGSRVGVLESLNELPKNTSSWAGSVERSGCCCGLSVGDSLKLDTLRKRNKIYKSLHGPNIEYSIGTMRTLARHRHLVYFSKIFCELSPYSSTHVAYRYRMFRHAVYPATAKH